MDDKSLQVLAESLHDLFQCPVCMHSLLPSHFLCKNGHGICSKCRSWLEKCPTCDTEFVELNRNTLLSNIYDTIPKCCQFEGCKKVKVLEDHEQFCEFRTTFCKRIGCTWTGCVKDLKVHLEVAHKTNVLCVKKIDSYNSYNLSMKFHEDYGWFLPILFEKYIFWLYIHRSASTKYISGSFNILPLEKPKSNYYLVLSLKTANVEFSITLKAVENLKYEDCFEPGESGMTVPDSELQKCFAQDGRCVFWLKIVKDKD